MILATPLQTLAPALVALAVWLLCLVKLRGEVRLPRGWWVLGIGVLFVRLVWVPALTSHIFDGHEAAYWDLFRGVGAPTRGGTVMIPAMQWFWWISGQMLPAWSKLPVLMMSVCGLAAVGLAAGAIGTLTDRRTGWVLAVLLTVHPAHAVWSSSAYNVIIPHFFGCMSLYAVARALRTPRPAWRWLAAASFALGVATRMDSGSMGLLAGMLVIAARGDHRLRRLGTWLLPGLGGLLMAALAAAPMLWPGALPGAGGRAIAVVNNLDFFTVYAPFDNGLALAALLVLVGIALMRKPSVAGPLVAVVLIHHAVMMTFDDFGERHALVVAPAILGLVAMATSIRRHIVSALAGVVLVLLMVETHDLSVRYYGSEAAFKAVLDQPPWSDLERRVTDGQPPEGCGWVVEDHRVAAFPVASHFNILDPEEEAQLRGPEGCLQWCVDTQDWRWSSRSVRDRAARLSHLFELSPSHVVVDPATGYACLALDVGQRTRSTPWSLHGNNATAPGRDISVP
jgi:hypothetical protein